MTPLALNYAALISGSEIGAFGASPAGRIQGRYQIVSEVIGLSALAFIIGMKLYGKKESRS